LDPEDFDAESFEPDDFEAADAFDPELLDPDALERAPFAASVDVSPALPEAAAALACVAVLAFVAVVSSLPHPAPTRARITPIVAVSRRCIGGTMASAMPAVAPA
jgi:hypothetical protein